MVAVNSRLFTLLSARQSWLGDRQTVLSRNIANADTPAFRPHDLSATDFQRQVTRPQPSAPSIVLASTDFRHLQPTRPTGGDAAKARTADGWEVAPAGNSVILEEQAERMAHTQMDYELGNDLYRKYVQMWRTAIGSGRG